MHFSYKKIFLPDNYHIYLKIYFFFEDTLKILRKFLQLVTKRAEKILNFLRKLNLHIH